MKYGLRPTDTNSSDSTEKREVQGPPAHPASASTTIPTATIDWSQMNLRIMNLPPLSCEPLWRPRRALELRRPSPAPRPEAGRGLGERRRAQRRTSGQCDH